MQNLKGESDRIHLFAFGILYNRNLMDVLKPSVSGFVRMRQLSINVFSQLGGVL